MKLFDDDFAQFEGGPLDGNRLFLAQQMLTVRQWPPPETIEVAGLLYERVSFSAITDEQRERMTHVCRGALYKFNPQMGICDRHPFGHRLNEFALPVIAMEPKATCENWREIEVTQQETDKS